MKRENPMVGVAMPPDVRSILENIASEREQSDGKRRVFLSDIIREAVEEYLKKRGYDVEVEVNRGGDRTTNED